MLRKTIYLGLALALTTSAAMLTACSSSDSDGNGQAGNNGAAGSAGNGAAGDDTGGGTGTPSQACSDPGTACGHAPAPADGAVAPDGTDSIVLAVNKLYLGDTDRQGNESDDAWKAFGFNLDDRVSKASSNDLCQPVVKADKGLVKADGNNGIDNSFGVNIIPLISTAVSGGATELVNDSIAKGTFTIMLKLDELGTGSDYKDLSASLYGGGDLSKIAGHENGPMWDGTDEWPVLCELLDDCALPSTKGSLDKPKIKFPNSYVSGRTWVSGTPGDVSLTLAIKGYSLSVVIHHATISMDLNDDNTEATNGVIGGVIATQELQASLKTLAAPLLNTCDVDAILELIGQASDIMKDGTQNPDATCDGISAGIGFDAKVVKLGDVTDPTEPAEDTCP